MLTFAVVVSRRGDRIPARVLDRMRDRTCADIPFDVGNHLVWANDRGSVHFAGWQDASDEVSAADHWHLDEDTLTAFTGHLWPRRDGWRGAGPWAQQLAERLRSTPLADGTDELAGVFVATSLHRTGRCSVAADPLGIGLVYWGEGRDVTVISSRAALAASLLAAEAASQPKRDTAGVGWLTYGVHAMGRQTGFDQITVIPEDTVVDIDPAGGARLLAPPRAPWRIDAERAAGPEQMLADARREMVTTIRMAAATPGTTICAGLTGGKDSRVILALLLAEGLADSVEFQTIGDDDLPDVLVAKQIAASFGLRHVVNPDRAESWAWRQLVDAAVRDGGHTDASSREIGFRMTAWTTSGAQNVAESHLGRPPAVDRLLLSGACGEALRTNYPGSSRFRSKSQMVSFPTELRLGAAGILRPAVLAHYQEEVHALLFEDCDDRDSPQDAVDAFYIRNRLRRWFGTTQEVDSQHRVFPLYSISAIRLAFAIGAENRHAEWVPYQLIRQSYEPLLHLPFANGDWPGGGARKLMRSRRHREPPPVAPPPAEAPASVGSTTTPPSRTVAADRRAKLRELDLEIMRRFLGEDPSNPVFELIDPVATARALDRFASLHERDRMQLYGALTAAVWLGGHEIALPRHLARAAR